MFSENRHFAGSLPPLSTPYSEQRVVVYETVSYLSSKAITSPRGALTSAVTVFYLFPVDAVLPGDPSSLGVDNLFGPRTKHIGFEFRCFV